MVDAMDAPRGVALGYAIQNMSLGRVGAVFRHWSRAIFWEIRACALFRRCRHIMEWRLITSESVTSWRHLRFEVSRNIDVTGLSLWTNLLNIYLNKYCTIEIFSQVKPFQKNWFYYFVMTIKKFTLKNISNNSCL